MERNLRIAGRIFAVVYAVFAVLMLVFAVVGTSMLRGLAATPLAIGQALNEADFREQLAPALLTALVDRLPDTLTVGNVTVQVSELTEPLLAADAQTISETILSPQWLQAQAAALVSGAVSRVQTGVSNQVDLLRSQFEGQPAFEIAQVILNTVRTCSDTEQQRLEQAAETGDYSVVDFVCNPSSAPEGIVRSTMRDIIIVMLGQLGRALADRLEAEFADFDLSQVVIETPIGQVRIVWPNLVVGQGFLSVTVPLPEGLVAGVDTAAANIQSGVQTAVANAQGVVSTSQANVEALATELVVAAETFSAPTVSPTPRPTITPIPTIAPEDRPINVVGDRLQEILVQLDAALTQVTNNLTTILWIVIVFLLVNMLIIILFALRTWPGLGLWVGVVLLASGIIVLLFGSRLSGRIEVGTTAAVQEGEPVAVAQLKTTIRQALDESFSAELSAPLITQGVVMLVAGAVLIAVVWFMGRQNAPPEAPAAAALVPPAEPPPAAPSTPETPAKEEAQAPPEAEKPDEPPDEIEGGATL